MSDPAGPMPHVFRLFSVVKVTVLAFLAATVITGLFTGLKNTNWASLAFLVIPLALLWIALRYVSMHLKIDIVGMLVRLLSKVVFRR